MILERYHGLGNDYLVLAAGDPLDAALVRHLCDRHRGVGADGVLEPAPNGRADFGVRIWNPDGSIAEKSGNGLRIYARWLRASGSPATMTVFTGFSVVACSVDGDRVDVEMGQARFLPDEVPFIGDGRWIEHPLDVNGLFLRVTAVGLGNPHCVLFLDEEKLDALPWEAWGRAIETHPAFPNRTNVQFAFATGGATVEARIWERGAGATSASGSSACAIAVAGVETGRLKVGHIAVHMPGGTLEVVVRDDRTVRLSGPVERVGRVELDRQWLEARRHR